MKKLVIALQRSPERSGVFVACKLTSAVAQFISQFSWLVTSNSTQQDSLVKLPLGERRGIRSIVNFLGKLPPSKYKSFQSMMSFPGSKSQTNTCKGAASFFSDGGIIRGTVVGFWDVFMLGSGSMKTTLFFPYLKH